MQYIHRYKAKTNTNKNYDQFVWRCQQNKDENNKTDHRGSASRYPTKLRTNLNRTTAIEYLSTLIDIIYQIEDHYSQEPIFSAYRSFLNYLNNIKIQI